MFRRKGSGFTQQPDPVPSLEGAVRRHIVFRGRVQGVGFRFTATGIGRRLGLTGWVKNEYDGSVTMEAQGRPERIDELLRQLSTDSYIRIREMDQRQIPLVEKERGFRATY